MSKSLNNPSGLKPLGRAVLVKHYKVDRLTSNLIAIPESVKAGMQMLEQHALVVEVGAHCWPDEPPRCAAGDKVIVSKFAGYLALGADGEIYRVVNDRDVFCAVTQEAEQERSVANG